jgi:hypothetical protein
MNRVMKLLCFLLAGVLSAMLFTTSSNAYGSWLGWDLVDSGKHLDYDGNSAYMIL